MMKLIQACKTIFMTLNKAEANESKEVVNLDVATKPAEAKTQPSSQKQYSSYQQAVHPLFYANRKSKFQAKNSVSDADMRLAGEAFHEMSDSQFTHIIQQLLDIIGYKKVDCDEDIITMTTNKKRVSVLICKNAQSAYNVMIKPVGLAQCQRLKEHMNQNHTDAGFIITAGMISRTSHDFIRNNQIFGLSSFELVRILKHLGVFDVNKALALAA